MKRAAVVLVLLVAACGSSAHARTAAPTPSPSPSSTPLSGPAAFVAYEHTATFGDRDFAGATDDNLLSLGNRVCDQLGSGLTLAKVTQDLVESVAKPTVTQASDLARHAIDDLCPSAG